MVAQMPPQFIRVIAQLTRVAHTNWESIPTFHSHGDAHASNGRFDNVLDIANLQAVTPTLEAIDFDIEIMTTQGAFGDDAKCAGYFFEDGFNLWAKFREFIQIRSIDFQS